MDEPIDQPRIRTRVNVNHIDQGNVISPPQKCQILDDIHLVNRGQNADQVLQRLSKNNAEGHQNLTRAVEQVLKRFGFNVGYANQPYFVSAFPNYVQRAELPRGWKAPKSLTKFLGENEEFIVKHIARYTMEIGELANVEYLKMRFFPPSLMKNAFIWFANLRLNSTVMWN